MKKKNSYSTKQLAILGLGTFLEFFDLMLYTHMAVILNDIFFYHEDPYTAQLNAVYSFLATFLLKPVGSLLFGMLGDKIGRMPVLIISMIIMAITCLTITQLPSYAEIGAMATTIIIICRVLQGMSVIGESIGAELYIAEGIEAPTRYYRVALIGFCGILGMFFSLVTVKAILSFNLDWRYIFYFGFVISLIGLLARISLREAKDYTDAKNFEIKYNINEIPKDNPIITSLTKKASIPLRIAYTMVFCGWPICFYFSYVYCGILLKTDFGFSKQDVITHNLYLSVINVVGLFVWIQLTRYVHPLKTVLFKIIILIPTILSIPYLLSLSIEQQNTVTLFILQSMILVFGNSTIPSKSVFIMHFPILKRFRLSSWYSSIAHIVVYLITTYVLVVVVHKIGYWGISGIFMILTFIFAAGILYFIKLEKRTGEYYIFTKKIK